jgi:hypothetical protein
LALAWRWQCIAVMFSSPFNWCDRRCERCRLSPVCGIGQGTLDFRDRLHVADDCPLCNDAEMMAGMSEHVLDDGQGPPFVSERARRLTAIIEGSPDFAAMSIDALVIATKIARLSEFLDDPKSDETYVEDGVPNLLLIERLIGRLHPTTAAAMREELAPVLAAIDPAHRRLMETLVETGVAPSPFFIDADADDIKMGAS